MATSTTNDSIYVSMDLESSLGKIEEDSKHFQPTIQPSIVDSSLSSMMMTHSSSSSISCCSPTRTSATYPFTLATNIPVEPVNLLEESMNMEEEEEEEEETTQDSTTKFINKNNSSTSNSTTTSCREPSMEPTETEDDEWGLDPTETEDDDSRYYLEKEAWNMTKSGLELEKIEDRLSFWK
jgi:hypothetical protein